MRVNRNDLKTWDSRWPNFSHEEVRCRGCVDRCPHGHNPLAVNSSSLDRLQRLRDIYKRPLKINSAYRCYHHNARVGGVKASQHYAGRAFDIDASGMTFEHRAQLVACAKAVGFKGFGFYSTFLHIDDRANNATWSTKKGEQTWKL
jgi:hypothetical protein